METLQNLARALRRPWAVGYLDSNTGWCVFRTYWSRSRAAQLVSQHGDELGLELRRL